MQDLKPSQIFLDEDLHLKIVDSGLKNALRKRKLDNAKKELSVYAAPEVFLGVDVNPRADIYSFGMILAFMLLGKDPPSQKVEDTIKQIKQIKQKGYGPFLTLITECTHEERGVRPDANSWIKSMEEIKAASGKVAGTPTGCAVM